MSEKWKMPSPDEILAVIDEWRRLNLASKNKEQVQAEFERVFSKILGVFQGETTTGGFTTFFRIREFDYLIGHVDELWAPPSNKTKKGRCNFEQEPVLYVSADGANCFEELNIQLEQQVYFIRYNKKVGSLLLRSVYGTDWDAIGLGKDVFCTDNDVISYKILREFLRSEFMKPTCRNCDGRDSIYNVTASIAGVLRRKQNVDGFIYRSALNLSSDNVALFPDAARNKLELKDVRILKVVSGSADEVVYETLFNGFPDDKGKVRWSSCSGSGSFRRISSESRL